MQFIEFIVILIVILIGIMVAYRAGRESVSIKSTKTKAKTPVKKTKTVAKKTTKK